MILSWQSNKQLHSATCESQTAQDIKLALAECIEKATSFLPENILDDSLFFLFEWRPEQAELSIVITDASKTNDAPERVQCSFRADLNTLAMEVAKLERDDQIHNAESLLLVWIKDYLSSCTSFMNFSLVAAFHTGNRDASIVI